MKKNSLVNQENQQTKNFTNDLKNKLRKFQTHHEEESDGRDSCGIGMIAHINGVKSHHIVADALELLKNLSHRGATGYDSMTGDGAGILIQTPKDFLIKKFADCDIDLSKIQSLAFGMIFFPKNCELRALLQSRMTEIAVEDGMKVLGWREVPVSHQHIGEQAKKTEPVIFQMALELLDGDAVDAEKELKLYFLRKKIEKNIYETEKISPNDFCVVSLSTQTMVYKGMLLPEQLSQYFLDLVDPGIQSALALVHSRFSTNTLPAWRLAHPFHMICHNGEINTIQGNRHWMKAREKSAVSKKFTIQGEQDSLYPVIRKGLSDSASFDEALQFLVRGGYSLPHALMMMVPEPWGENAQTAYERQAFYEYSSTFMEPWDGPSAIAFTDGRFIGALLDRNGLRPCRYQLTTNDLVIIASETGTLDYSPELIKKKGRLAPGKMFLVDTVKGEIFSDGQVKNSICQSLPYEEWLLKNRFYINQNGESLPVAKFKDQSPSIHQQMAAGYTQEEWNRVLLPMLKSGDEAISSMGNDTPLAVLSLSSQLLFKYFRQLFAQVTNPPIDPIREQLVMSLKIDLGRRPTLFHENEADASRISLQHPILTPENIEEIHQLKNHNPQFIAKTISFLFESSAGALGLKQCLLRIAEEATDAIESGYSILILSDRGVNDLMCAAPSLLALASLHHHLIREGIRLKASIVVESAEPRDVHHFACLLGYGANAVCPYLMFDLMDEMEIVGARKNYIHSLKKGLLKILSKMGISTLQSYQGAQIFEIIGLHQDVADLHFTGTNSRIQGMGLDEIAKETILRHTFAFSKSNESELLAGGDIHYRRGSEIHQWNPETIAKLQHATATGNPNTFREFSDLINAQNESGSTLRGLLKFQLAAHPIPLDEVESANSIVKYFTTGAMSLGALGKEAHETLAVAMNRIGGKSNSGEGGEDARRFELESNGDSKSSYIKQVASARFGVTTHYLVNAKELQIKVAQGAKPGEGGQIPGYKVDAEIARVRHSTPGVTLISPPPHHDIYSIEDLAQLIFDLKNVNPKAEVSVKLVSELGVGTIAAGVVKAHADKILISGDSGGTGASPVSSIKYAGAPWELGIAETHQSLIAHGLRSRVRLETDGQLKTGRDVVMAALLGAEEFGFSTAPLVVEGCVMMRKCHLNTCPVGVATQDPELRKKFKGQAENVIRYFFFVAEEVREIMAQLGFRTMAEMVGRTERLKCVIPKSHWKAQGIDLSCLFKIPTPPVQPKTHFLGCTEKQDHNLDKVLDHSWIKHSELALKEGKKVEITAVVSNVHRSLGSMLSGVIATKWGAQGLPEDTISIKLKGTAGQSFGAFLASGVTLELVGEANDYVGKGLSGGKIIVYPPANSLYLPSNSILVGNTCLYGATSGEAYFYGKAGERFAVRNSGATVVVEGCGDHGCEYMTGGTVVILGTAGKNFAAGMSGGQAFVFDRDKLFSTLCNHDMVDLEPMTAADEDAQLLFNLIEKYWRYTKSEKAGQFLLDWPNVISRFVKVIPKDYKRVKKVPVTASLPLLSNEVQVHV
jgi:glutamate synthase (NADPH/NADH) large chain/glutamate synthase (ferredoxin)